MRRRRWSTSCGLTPAASSPTIAQPVISWLDLEPRPFAPSTVFVLGKYPARPRRPAGPRGGRRLGAGRGEAADQQHAATRTAARRPVGSERRGAAGGVPRRRADRRRFGAPPLEAVAEADNIRTSAGPATSANTMLPVAWATSNGMPSLEDREAVAGTVRRRRWPSARSRGGRRRRPRRARRPLRGSAGPRCGRRAPAPRRGCRTFPTPPSARASTGPGRARSWRRAPPSAPTAKPGAGAERVAREEDDVGGRHDVGEGGEGDPPGDRQRGERGDEGDDLRGRPRALVPGEPAEQDGGKDHEADDLPVHAAIAGPWPQPRGARPPALG